MIYKLRKDIDIDLLNLRCLIENPHPGTTQIIEENLDELEMEDFYDMLQYPNYIHLILTRLSIIMNSSQLSKNPEAIPLLIKYPEMINWFMFSLNPHPKAMEIIEQNIIKEQIEPFMYPGNFSEHPENWILLARNQSAKAIEIIEKYYYYIENLDILYHLEFWEELSKNQYAIRLLEKYPNNIDWDTIIENPKAGHIIEQNLDKVKNWNRLAVNTEAVHIIEKNLHKLYNWCELSGNSKAFYILEKNLDKVDWVSFSKNPSAIHILIEILREKKKKETNEENNLENHPEDYKYYNYLDKVDYRSLSINPAIFEVDTQGLKERCDIYRKELMEKVMHPRRMIALLDQEGIQLEDLEDYW